MPHEFYYVNKQSHIGSGTISVIRSSDQICQSCTFENKVDQIEQISSIKDNSVRTIYKLP